MDSSISQIRSKLERYSPGDLAESSTLAHAAVSILLRDAPASGDTEVLMIRRAELPRDPWSGHMGFPGGHVDACDSSPERAGVRETQEELGISLDSCATRLGRLSELQASARSKPIPLSIFPYVYELVKPVDLHPNCEVVEALWIPLAFFLSSANRAAMLHPDDHERALSCYRLEDRVVVWGLSLSMLDELLSLLMEGAAQRAE
jgi:8-oxo-dGTP pyrophosphatase MutT (NUDIX family)